MLPCVLASLPRFIQRSSFCMFGGQVSLSVVGKTEIRAAQKRAKVLHRASRFLRRTESFRCPLSGTQTRAHKRPAVARTSLMSDQTSRQCFEGCWRRCEASSLDRLMTWQKPTASSAKQQSINNTALASVSRARSAHPSLPPSLFCYFSFSLFLCIHHHFLKTLFFSWKSGVFLITSGPFITNDTLHIALQSYSGCRGGGEWGVPSHCVLLH